MRNLAIFILSFPLLVLAVLSVPLGLALDVIAAPIWLSLIIIARLRGEEWDFGIFKLPPLMVFAMYFEITGFCPRLADALDPV